MVISVVQLFPKHEFATSSGGCRTPRKDVAEKLVNNSGTLNGYRRYEIRSVQLCFFLSFGNQLGVFVG